MQDTKEIVRDLSKGILMWYQFQKEESVLYIGDSKDCISELLFEKQKDNEIADYRVLTEKQLMTDSEHLCGTCTYDIVIAGTALEQSKDVGGILKLVAKMLKPYGRLLLMLNNRLGIRYFCGDRDPYTKRNFDSIENYRKVLVKQEDSFLGRMYDKAEIDMFLTDAGFSGKHFFSVFPSLDNPSLIYSEDYIPNEELNIRCFPLYNSPETVFLEEEYLYTDLIKNGLFHKMANAFFVECFINAEDTHAGSDVLHVTASLDRGREDALFTIIHTNGVVEKKAVYPEGRKRLVALLRHNEELSKRGISVIAARLEGDSYSMPFVEAETGLVYLRRMAHSNTDLFINAMDRFRDTILQSSELCEIEMDGRTEVCLRRGYFDLVPLNCFIVNDEYVFYDQEFVLPDCPIGVMLARLVDLVYQGEVNLERIVPRDFFLERYNIRDRIDEYRRISVKFLRALRKEDVLRVHYEKHRRSNEIVDANRRRMNYSEEDYQRYFVDIFQNLGDRSLILFGSGAFTKRFLAMYGKDYEVAAIIDNNASRQGQFIDGIQIQSPDILKDFDENQYKILICIKNYLSVVRQLENMGISEYGIFDSSRSYARPIYKQIQCNQTALVSQEQKKKQYHIGYVAGVFDMFHIGHVRLLEKAKEQCEYLIVGVVSDEDCFRQKVKYPIISCKERVEVVKACKYVDQVELLPTGFSGIRDAYKMFQFDVQFSGDDHGDEGDWLADKEYLNKHGADLVFFDYTKETSSTEIRKKLQE